MEEQRLLELDLSTASQELIEVLIEEATDPSVYGDIAKANMKRPEVLRLVLASPDTPEEVRQQISDALHVPVKVTSETAKVKKTPEMRSLTLLQRIQKLSFGDKRLLALRGGKEVRSLLLKDPNKEVAFAVLENPKITETEVEVVARSRSTPEEVIRKITKKREWMKTYSIVLAIVSNPKTPPGNAVPLVSELKIKDLSVLEKSKNVSEAVRFTARRLLQARRGT
jgi:hypothetical protein